MNQSVVAVAFCAAIAVACYVTASGLPLWAALLLPSVLEAMKD